MSAVDSDPFADWLAAELAAPAPIACVDPECPDFGDPDFGQATCPEDHAGPAGEMTSRTPVAS